MGWQVGLNVGGSAFWGAWGPLLMSTAALLPRPALASGTAWQAAALGTVAFVIL